MSRNMTPRGRLWAAVAAIAFAAAVAAQPADRTRAPATAGGGLPPSFNSYDLNQDGRITHAEAANDPALAAEFPVLDRNRNQELDAAEFARFEGRAPPPELEPFDRPAPADGVPPRESVPPPPR